MDASLHIQHEQFPDLPAKALEYFHPRNANKTASRIDPRTVLEFAMHVGVPNGDSSKRTLKPHRLNLILGRMADLNLLTIARRGQHLGGLDAAYLCELSDEEIKSVLPWINYAVYGFPVIYKELWPAVLPIVRTNDSGRADVGSSYLAGSNLVVTAKHCLVGAKSLSIGGVSAEAFRSAKVVVHNNEALDLAAIWFPVPVLPRITPIGLSEGDILDEVLVMGYPNVPGFTEFIAAEKAAVSARITVSRGAITAKAYDMFAKAELLLITARVRGGFSGGPVLSSRGSVVGIISREPIAAPADAPDFVSQYDNLGYGVAIPANEISVFLQACLDGNSDVVSALDVSSVRYE